MTVGALRPPFWPPMPVETAAPSVNPLSGRWQVAHATVASEERRLSKKSSQPRSRRAAEYGLSSGQKIGGKPRGGLGGLSCAPPPTAAPRPAATASTRPARIAEDLTAPMAHPPLR